MLTSPCPTGPFLHPLDPDRPDPPDPAFRFHGLARLQKPDHNRPLPRRCPGRRLQRRLHPGLRPLAARLPPPLPAVHLDHGRHLALCRLRCHRTVLAHQAEAERLQPTTGKTSSQVPLARYPTHGDEL